MDVGDLTVLVAEGIYTSLLQFVDFRVFIDRDYRQTLKARKRRARDKFELFVEDGLGPEHQLISGHRQWADLVIPADFGSVQLQEPRARGED